MEHLDGALGFLDEAHGHKSVAFRAMGIPVVDDVDIANRSDAFEKVFDVLLVGIVGEVAKVETLGVDPGGVWNLALATTTFSTATFPSSAGVPDVFAPGFPFFLGSLLSRDAVGLTGGRLVEAKDVQEFLPKCDWLTWPTISAAVAVASASVLAATVVIAIPASAALVAGLTIVVVSVTVPVSVAVPVPVAVPVFGVRGTLTGRLVIICVGHLFVWGLSPGYRRVRIIKRGAARGGHPL